MARLTVLWTLLKEMMIRKDMEENFDYTKAIAELEAIAAKVEDPKTALGDIE